MARAIFLKLKDETRITAYGDDGKLLAPGLWKNLGTGEVIAFEDMPEAWKDEIDASWRFGQEIQKDFDKGQYG